MNTMAKFKFTTNMIVDFPYTKREIPNANPVFSYTYNPGKELA